MRIGVVTDSCCDLPRSFLDENNIVILPVSIIGPMGEFADTRDPNATQAFYRDVISTGEVNFESRPFSPDQIRELFLGRLVVEFDYVFCITVTKNRSLTFENANHASMRILNEYRPIREAAGIKAPFALRVFDSGNLFPGQGLIVAEVVRLIKQGVSTVDIIRHLERLSQTTQSLLIPSDLGQLRNQARRKGDKSIGFVAYALATALDIKPILRGYRGDTHPMSKVRGFDAGLEKVFDSALYHLREGLLLAPTICISYGGNPADVEAMPIYQTLVKEARQRDVSVYLSEMSVTGGVNIGVGGVAVAFASEQPAQF